MAFDLGNNLGALARNGFILGVTQTIATPVSTGAAFIAGRVVRTVSRHPLGATAAIGAGLMAHHIQNRTVENAFIEDLRFLEQLSNYDMADPFVRQKIEETLERIQAKDPRRAAEYKTEYVDLFHSYLRKIGDDGNLPPRLRPPTPERLKMEVRTLLKREDEIDKKIGRSSRYAQNSHELERAREAAYREKWQITHPIQ